VGTWQARDARRRPSAEFRAPAGTRTQGLALSRRRRPLAASGASVAPTALRRRICVGDALGVRAAVALELGLDPVHRIPVALRPLPSIPELGEPLDRRLVLFQIEPTDEGRDRGVRRRHANRRFRSRVGILHRHRVLDGSLRGRDLDAEHAEGAGASEAQDES
jgi:hypothetical protein